MLCTKNIIGFNTNPFHLWAIMQKRPVGQFRHVSEYNVNDLVKNVKMKNYLNLWRLILKY